MGREGIRCGILQVPDVHVVYRMVRLPSIATKSTAVYVHSIYLELLSSLRKLNIAHILG